MGYIFVFSLYCLFIILRLIILILDYLTINILFFKRTLLTLVLRRELLNYVLDVKGCDCLK